MQAYEWQKRIENMTVDKFKKFGLDPFSFH